MRLSDLISIKSVLRSCVTRAKLQFFVFHLLVVFIVPSFFVSSAQADEAEEAVTSQPTPRSPEARRSRTTRDQSEAQADKRKLLLTFGEEKPIDLDFETEPKKVYVGDPRVVTFNLAKIDGKQQIILKPTKPGDTTILIRDMDGEIQLIFNVKVTLSNLSRVATELKSLLRDIEGLEIKVVGQRVVLDGEILTPSDYGRILAVVGTPQQKTDYTDSVLPLMTLSPLALQVIAKKIQDDIRVFAGDGVTTRVVNGTIWLEGEVGSADEKVRAGEIAVLYIPEIRPTQQIEKDINAMRVPPRSMVNNFLRIKKAPPPPLDKLIRITVYFVELSKDYNRLFAFKWQPSFTPTGEPQISIGQRQDGTTGAEGTSFSAVISSLIPKLQTAQNAGYARVLKTGTVITKSGAKAVLKEQTEFTSLVQRVNDAGLSQLAAQKTPVGLSIEVLPKVVGQTDDIEMLIDMTQSAVVGSVPTGDRAPTVASHSVNTALYLKTSESAALAGVTGQEINTDFNKAPSASDPLFQLNRSKEYKKKNNRFVVFVTPQIVESASQSSEDLKRDFRVRAN
ncbi:MAG: pilus assembly protein N-terminal domain-containing protein [Bdellovibrionales bacterium]|nr:pilus assembly protein N-terminal domain-containing protein [Bdellovibrionales bacterium]